MPEEQENIVAHPEHLQEFLEWLTHPPRSMKVSDPLKIIATSRTLESYRDEHGMSHSHVLSGRPAVWWKGLAIQDYGAYRLAYLGD